MSNIAKSKFTVDSDSDGVLIAKDNIHCQLTYLTSMSNFLTNLNAQPANNDTMEKIKFLQNNKNKLYKLEKALSEKGRKGLAKGMENLLGEDSQDLAFKISEFLLYSRNISVEHVLEIIGDKRETEVLKEFLKKFGPLMKDKNVEQALRKLFTSFRLAGVESQTVERVLENFGHFYYDLYQTFNSLDGIITFANKNEAYEFVYLLIMLHTCHHNPNLENKTNFKWFLDSVKDL